MRLSTFIKSHLEEILGEWDKFARTLFSSEEKLSDYRLRDHAREVLLELTVDMQTGQSPQQQSDKSNGAVSPNHPDDSAATVHGVQRHDDGLTVSEVAAEFHALRGSVLRLWLPKISVMSKEVVIDIIRFDKAIDQALADSLITYDN